MEFINYTPFAGNAWDTVNAYNLWHCTTLVRVRFQLRKNTNYSEDNPQWDWHLHPEQGDLFSEDCFHQNDSDIMYRQTGDRELASIRYESDYVNYKANTDIAFNAATHSPHNNPAKSWSCGVKVYPDIDAMHRQKPCNTVLLKALALKSHPSSETIEALPVRYEYCRGGITKIKGKGEDQQIILDLDNPVGIGSKHLPQPDTDSKKVTLPDVQLHYIEPKAMAPIPPGLGLLHRGWRSRLAYAGTYDETWLAEQHPLPPYDFDYRHNQAAHPALMTNGYLPAGACIEWHNLQAGEAYGYCIVPEYRFLSRIHTELDVQYSQMHLDTLIFDLDNEDPNERSVYASWRSYTPLLADTTRSEAILLPLSSPTQTDDSVKGQSDGQ